MISIQEQFGNIDIYVFDQILKGRIQRGMKILDAGCGDGRNLTYLLREGHKVYGIDADRESLDIIRATARRLAPRFPEQNFQLGTLENPPFPNAFFDFIICNAVLHFATDDRHFMAMLSGMWRVLKPGGILFCRLASSIGMETQIKQIAGRVYFLPDESERYLVDEALLEKLTNDLKAGFVDPIKTTIVQNQRCMTTWVIQKLEPQ